MFPEATRVPPKLVVPSGNPGIPRRGFSFGEARHPGALVLGLCVGDRQARADCQCGELIDRIAAGTPVRKLLFVEALGHARVPFLGDRPDHRAGLELATIDAHRAAEAVPIGISCGSGWVWSFMSLLLRRRRAPLNAASPADRYEVTDHVPVSPTRRVGYHAALARAACAASGT